MLRCQLYTWITPFWPLWPGMSGHLAYVSKTGHKYTKEYPTEAKTGQSNFFVLKIAIFGNWHIAMVDTFCSCTWPFLPISQNEHHHSILLVFRIRTMQKTWKSMQRLANQAAQNIENHGRSGACTKNASNSFFSRLTNFQYFREIRSLCWFRCHFTSNLRAHQWRSLLFWFFRYEGVIAHQIWHRQSLSEPNLHMEQKKIHQNMLRDRRDTRNKFWHY